MSMWSLPIARDAARRRSCVAVRADDDVRDADAPFLGGWSAGDGCQPTAVDERAQRIGLSARRSVRGSPNARRSRGVPCPACPLGVVIVDDDVCAERHHPRGAALARGRDHRGAAVRGELDDHPAGDAAGAVDQDRLTGLNVEHLGHHLLTVSAGTGNAPASAQDALSGFSATRRAGATSRSAQQPW